MNKVYNIVIIILVFLLIFFMKQCSDTDNNAKKDREKHIAKEFKLNTHVNKLGQLITEQQQLIVTTKKERDEAIEEVDNLSNITEQVRAETITKIDTIIIPLDNPTIINKPEGKFLMLPCNFRKLDNPWYGFTGTILTNGTERIDSLWIINKPTITFGMEKWNWKKPTKKRIPEVAFEDKNPYNSVKSMKNVKFDKPLPKISIGLQGGTGYMFGKGFGGYIGIGLNYNLITF